jgi:hypothetical protein
MPPQHRRARSLTNRVYVRISPVEKAALRAMAKVAGVPVAELVRLRSLGRPVIPRTDATTIRELRRLGGLLKKIHVDSGGTYSMLTAEAIMALRAAIVRIATESAGGRGGGPERA